MDEPATLPDILAPGLAAVLVGINPSLYSVARGHYFARPSNAFWRLLHETGLVPLRLRPEDDRRLLEFGLGVTDVVKRPTVGSDDLRPEDYDAGRDSLRAKLEAAAPRAVCFVGGEAYRGFFGRRAALWGRQAETIGGAVVFCMPSTSGRAARLERERRRCLLELAAFLERRGAKG